MKECIIIYNPLADKGRIEKRLYLYKNELLCKGYTSVKTISTNKEGNYEGVLDKAVDLIVSIGGDGTFRTVASLVSESKYPETLIVHDPAGTANDLKEVFSFESTRQRPLVSLSDLVEMDLDIFKINDENFTYVSAFGLFTDLAYKSKSENKKTFGKAAYITPAFKEIIKPFTPVEMECKIDGKKYNGNYLLGIVSNSPKVATFNLYDDAVLNDGKLEVCLIKDMPKVDFIKNIGKIALGRKLGSVLDKDIILTRVSEVNIAFDSDVAWTIDGEEAKLNREIAIKPSGQAKILTTKDSFRRFN